MQNLKLTISFDGTHFSGWQRQLNAPTIQGELEKVLGTITNTPVTLHGAGRTDAGVHALAMVAHFETDSTIPLSKLQSGANCMLPAAIRILQIERVPAEFHARFSTISKTYFYNIDTGSIQPPINRLYATHIPTTLALAPMYQCMTFLQGNHDFASFEASGSRDKSITTGRGSIRTLHSAKLLKPKQNRLQFELIGDGFLRHMVRNIVGTLLDVGKERKNVQEFRDIFAAKNRSLASATAPAHGLFLKEVHYSPQTHLQ